MYNIKNYLEFENKEIKKVKLFKNLKIKRKNYTRNNNNFYFTNINNFIKHKQSNYNDNTNINYDIIIKFMLFNNDSTYFFSKFKINESLLNSFFDIINNKNIKLRYISNIKRISNNEYIIIKLNSNNFYLFKSIILNNNIHKNNIHNNLKLQAVKDFIELSFQIILYKILLDIKTKSKAIVNNPKIKLYTNESSLYNIVIPKRTISSNNTSNYDIPFININNMENNDSKTSIINKFLEIPSNNNLKQINIRNSRIYRSKLWKDEKWENIITNILAQQNIFDNKFENNITNNIKKNNSQYITNIKNTYNNISEKYSNKILQALDNYKLFLTNHFNINKVNLFKIS